MCNALNAMAIVICFTTISAFIGIRESAWHIVVTVAIIISTFYSANYFSALESRNDRRRFFLFAWVVVTIILTRRVTDAGPLPFREKDLTMIAYGRGPNISISCFSSGMPTTCCSSFLSFM